VDSIENLDQCRQANDSHEDNEQKISIDTIASLNFRINEYLDEIIKLKTTLKETNEENAQLKGSRRSVVFANLDDKVSPQGHPRKILKNSMSLDNSSVKRTDEEILTEKLDKNFKVKMNHVKINQKDARKNSLNNSMNSDIT